MKNADSTVSSCVPDRALSNPNSLWGYLLVETLKALGLEYAIISPGSRSTPLTYAFASDDTIESIPVLDERSAAFFALGLAKKSQKPVVLLCTSGTAVANYYPAIIEARESSIPLLVLSTDRPAELRNNHSGQTIDQLKIFGNYPVYQAEMPLPENSEESIQFLRQQLMFAWEKCLQPSVGPVHLNFPFKDPLAPLLDPECAELFKDYDFRSYFAPLKHSSSYVQTQLLSHPRFYRKGIIIAGTVQGIDEESYCSAIFKLAKKLSWPVLADPLGPWRNWVKPGMPVVTLYDTILRNSSAADRLRPDTVLQVGQLPTSKYLRQFLKENPCKTWICDAAGENHDPLNRGAQHLRVDLVSFEKTAKLSSPEKCPKLTSRWLKAQELCDKSVNRSFMQCDFLFEAFIPRILSENLPEESHVFISNSMPIRDCENFWQAGNGRYSIFCNRGANGIDGILSTALGVAHKQTNSVLLTGDLTLLHDSNAFLLLPEFKGHLTIVLVNNNGGGIFENLAIAKFNPEFERFFATPQKVDFKKLAELHGIQYMEAKRFEDLVRLIKLIPPVGVRIIELKTDRKRDVPFRNSILDEASQTVVFKP